MPTRKRLAKARLAALIAEQQKDAKSCHVFSESITPLKSAAPAGITPNEYIQLLLELGNLTRKQISEALNISPKCISQHRWSAYQKLGLEYADKWKKASKSFKVLHLFLLPALESPPGVSKNGESD